MEWTYSIGKDCVILEHKPLYSCLVDATVTWRPIEWALTRTGPTYRIYNAILNWADSAGVEVMKLPITVDQRDLLTWESGWDSDASAVTFSKQEKKEETAHE